MGFQYVAPTQPLNRHAEIVPTTTAHQLALLTAENDLLKHDWAIVKGFGRALSLNIQDTLDSRYHNQLKHSVLQYRNVLPRQYIQHLKTVWVMMDKRIWNKLTKN